MNPLIKEMNERYLRDLASIGYWGIDDYTFILQEYNMSVWGTYMFPSYFREQLYGLADIIRGRESINVGVGRVLAYWNHPSQNLPS